MIPIFPICRFAIGNRITHNVSGENFTVVGNPYDMMKGIYFYNLENDAGTRTLTEPTSVVEQNYSVVLPQGYVGSIDFGHDKFDEEASGSWKPINLFGRGNCDHDWARYTGFTNSYDYCKKCNEEKFI